MHKSGSSPAARPAWSLRRLAASGRWRGAWLCVLIALAAVGCVGDGAADPSPPTSIASPATAAVTPAAPGDFTFAVAVDQRNFAGKGFHDRPVYFLGVAEAIKARGEVAFMVSPGDIDPPSATRWTLDKVFGSGFLWYPGVGNHEAETPADMAWLRAYDPDPNGRDAAPDPNIVRRGPPGCLDTTYSFDHGNAHFVMLNEYCDASGDTATDGDITEHLYEWLRADLASTDREHIFVLGHEPAYVQPDADNGRVRHKGDSLDAYPANRDRFWNLLRSRGVRAYINGHSHNYSVVEIDGVWQIDAGHARGLGDWGAPSTFVLVHVSGDSVIFNAYRERPGGEQDYDDIVHHGIIAGPSQSQR